MATTKVINDLIDLNQTGNTTALKGCKGDNANQPQTPTISVDYLVVGGGGAAAGSGSGGGGAGGLSTGTIAVPNNTEVSIVVGLGGSAGSFSASQPNGEDSGFYTIQGQGGGAAQHRANGSPGGSGAGGGKFNSAATGGAGVSGQGNSGGATGSSDWENGGGGGSGGSGYNASSSQSGAGGIGTDVAGGIITQANGITASVGEDIGSTLNFAGGGGGGGYGANLVLSGAGGNGGGGAGSPSSGLVGISGTQNTGGGGGGGWSTSAASGGSGGSGVVILKYASTATETIAGSLIGGINTSDNSAVRDFPAGTVCQALYQFENNTNDSTTNNYDPTSQANISFPTSSPAPKFGTYSLYMNGSSSYVNGIPQALATTLRTAGLFTFSMWINPIAAPSSTADFIRFIDNIYVRILINSNLTLGYVVIPVAGTYIEPPLTTSVAKINLNEWSHICLTGSVANGIKFYINGQQEAYNPAWVGTFMTYTDTNYKTNGLNGSSGLPGNANQVMNGNIDNFRVYNQELSSSQVLELVNMNTTTKFTESSDTVLVFKGGSGTINLTDTSLPGSKVGDLRTNEDQTSGGSASAMEHYMSTGWRVLTNIVPLTSTCNYPTPALALYQLNSDGGVTNNVPNTCSGYPATSSNITYATGNFGNGAVFNGSNSKINLGTSSTWANNKLSFSFWYKPTAAPSGATYEILFSNYSTSFANGFFNVSRNSNYSLEIGLYAGSGWFYRLTGANAVVLNQWTHVVITLDNTESSLANKVKFYINGSVFANTDNTSSGTPSGDFLNNSESFYVGHWDHQAGYNDAAVYDQLRIFASVLTPTQVEQLYLET